MTRISKFAAAAVAAATTALMPALGISQYESLSRHLHHVLRWVLRCPGTTVRAGRLVRIPGHHGPSAVQGTCQGDIRGYR